jgi:LysM repeat protein
MKTASVYRKTLLVAVVFITLLIGNIHAQETNLLVNGGFETGFNNVQGDQPRNVAQGWTPWNSPRTDSMPSFQNTQPKYIAASTAIANGVSPRIRTGNDAQIYFSFYETHDGGLYQRVTGITPGTELRFSVYAYVWSTTYDDPNQSEDPGDVAFRVGIDPTGGTDATSSNVVYSTPTVAYDAYRQASVIATAQGNSVTVFIRSSVGQPVQYSYIYVDDAVLASTSSAAPTATNTRAAVVASNTPVPVQASNTPVRSTNTPVPAATNTTAPVVASNTPVPVQASNTPVSVEPATPTPENNGGLLPTATSIAIATNTPAPNQPTATTAPGGGTGGPITDRFPGTIIHRVSRGDTVYDIARLYGSDIEAIVQANTLDENAAIQIDQRLVIPVRLVVPPTPVPSATPLASATPVPSAGGGGGSVTPPINLPAGTELYTVQRGDTLLTISRRFNTTIGALTQLNAIANPNLIFAGQRIIVPSLGGTGGPVIVPTTPAQPTAQPTPQATSYTVQPGDNLYRISLRFNRSMQAIATANNITNFNRIFAGQVLVIP